MSTTNPHSGRLLRPGAAALAAAGIVLGATFLAHGRTAVHAERSSASHGGFSSSAAAASASSGGAVSVPPVSQATISNRADARTFLAWPSNGTVAEVNFGQSLRVARSEFSDLVGRGAPAEASLMTVTMPDHGRDLETDPAMPSRVVSDIDGRLCWALVFNDVPIPVTGPQQDGSPGATQIVKQPFLVLIDAHTGAFVHAETL